MTLAEFKALLQQKSVPDACSAIAGLVRAWRYYHNIRFVFWVDHGRYYVWVEYGDEHGLSGHAAVEGVRGEASNIDAAIRDCAAKWFAYLDKVEARRREKVESVLKDLERGFNADRRGGGEGEQS